MSQSSGRLCGEGLNVFDVGRCIEWGRWPSRTIADKIERDREVVDATFASDCKVQFATS